jgi:hypothetical protein
MLNALVFIVGWLLFVAGQAKNSISSKSNSLTGWAGFRVWLAAHSINLLTRAFFSGMAYGFIIHTVTTKLQVVGFPVTSTMIAGFGGWSANGLLYQFLGFFPWMRVEMSDLAPPINGQTAPLPKPPATP